MGQFFDLLTAHYRYQFMGAAVELDLFTALDREPGLRREELERRLSLHERPTRVLLLGCLNVGLLRKDGERFFNTPLGALLSTDHPASRADFVRWEQLRYRGMGWFTESLRSNSNCGLREFAGSGETLYERVAENPALRPTFHNVMGAITEDIAAMVMTAFDFGSFRHVLDVGGGAAAVYARGLIRRWPELRVTICDLPSVAEAARGRIETEGLSGRVSAVGLDCLNEEFPDGADCILFSHFLEMWSPDRIRGLLQKACRALVPGGSVLIVTPCSNDDESGPWLSAHLAAYFQAIATCEGMVYTRSEFERWVTEAGLRPGAEINLPLTFVMQGIKAS